MKISLALFLCLSAAVGGLAIPDYAYTQRAPDYPLAVRAPYASIWLPHNELPGNWPAFWTGTTKGWQGMIRVDGVAYEFMGAASKGGDNAPIKRVAVQNSAVVTPTQTIFSITAGPVDLEVLFFSPVEYEDVKRQSIPLSHVLVKVTPNDGNSHEVQLYQDITGEWASSEAAATVKWSLNTTSTLKRYTTERVEQFQFSEWADYPQWGQAIFITSEDATHLSGADLDVRAAFVSTGKLSNEDDDEFRCVSCRYPTFAFAHDLGTVAPGASKTVRYAVGHIREYNIHLRGTPQKALWTHYFENVNEMVQFFWDDLESGLERANTLDVKILNDAFRTGGQDHANVVAMSLRQAYAGTEFSGNITYPLLYLKEISSNGNMQTVDVMYPAIPMFYYLNPVEESANMLLMVGNIALHPNADEAESIEYVKGHFTILKQWANFLYENCLYPVNQLTTDDFIGPTQLNSGLALKGILGIKTFARLARLIGEVELADQYDINAAAYTMIWELESMHNDKTHLKMEYNVTNGYQFKYNAFQDKVLSLNVVPQRIYELEANYYLTKEEPYGIPFVSTHDYTKSDWEVWTAAAFGEASPELRTLLIGSLSRYLKYTPSRVPFSDWYVTATSNQVGFQSRPVVGGHFAILALETPARP
ncbi:unnamed protein product [Allacma fusca]|uniref:Glutaminase n=1 Tax=Allacma fusca TaxID=39272 RepID=A0A8J2LQK2_9HEXA|nr:unnamed protein product [Allacma fusca]